MPLSKCDNPSMAAIWQELTSFQSLRCLVIVAAFAPAFPQSGVWSSMTLSVLLWLWICWEIRTACSTAEAAVRGNLAFPLRVAAFAQNGLCAHDSDWRSTALALDCEFSASEAVQRFDGVRQHTHCVFARRAVLWGNDWRSEGSEDSTSESCTLNANIPRLYRFCLEVESGKPLDGFIFEIRGVRYSTDLDTFASTVRRVLMGLSAGDPAGADCMKSSSSIARKGWYFQFAREPLFVTTFAPCYPSANPRFQFGIHPDSCFVLLQPEESFLRHDLPPDKPYSATNWVSPEDVRDRIRSNFRCHGREYRIPETVSYPPAEFVVASLDVLSDPSVRFWCPHDK